MRVLKQDEDTLCCACCSCPQVISKRKLGTQQEVQDVQREVQILQQLQGHPNIVDLIKVYEDKQNICIVTEFCAGERTRKALGCCTIQAASALHARLRLTAC